MMNTNKMWQSQTPIFFILHQIADIICQHDVEIHTEAHHPHQANGYERREIDVKSQQPLMKRGCEEISVESVDVDAEEEATKSFSKTGEHLAQRKSGEGKGTEGVENSDDKTKRTNR